MTENNYYGNQPQDYGQQPINPNQQQHPNYNPPPQNPIIYQNQQYMQEKQPLHNKGQGNQYGNEGQRFEKKSKWNDVFWAIAFYLQLALMVVLSIYYFAKNHNKIDEGSGFLNKHFWVLLVIVCVSSIISSIAWLGIIRKYAYCMIWFALVTCLALWFLMGVVAIASGNAVSAIICFIFCGLQGLWMYCVRHRIRFAAAVLELAIEACNEFSNVYFVSIGSVGVQLLWLIIWTMGVAFATKSNTSSLAIVLFILSFYWTIQVISNVVHVTCSGVVATWYFLFPNQTPETPVKDALNRSMTTSFGSICFGSFLVAVIQTIKYLVQSARSRKNEIIQCIVVCILNCLENLLNYFNFYAFTRVAIYGLGYWQAAKETWELFKRKGFDIIINDDLIGPVLSISCFLSGLVSALITTLVCWIYFNGTSWEPWIAVAFVCGFALTLCVLVVVRSGVATIFVCFAEDPAALSLKPQAYSKLTGAWRARHGSLPPQLTN